MLHSHHLFLLPDSPLWGSEGDPILFSEIVFLYGFIFVYIYKLYIIESVCLFAVNVKTTARVDSKRSGITKNDPESVLC